LLISKVNNHSLEGKSVSLEIWISQNILWLELQTVTITKKLRLLRSAALTMRHPSIRKSWH
jgi:hypothetical protein